MPAEYVQKIRDKFPGSYDDLSDQELAAKVITKYPEYRDVLGDVANPPNAVTRAYQDYIAKPLTSAVEVPLRGMTAPFVDAARVFNGESPRQVFQTPTSALESGAVKGVKPQEKQNAMPFAEAVVPQTPIQAGLMVGSMVAPPLAASRYAPTAVQAFAKVHPALARIFGGTVGGGVGGTAEGEPVRGGAEGAAGSVLGETLRALFSRLRLAPPGGQGAPHRRGHTN